MTSILLCALGIVAEPLFVDKTAELGLVPADSAACWVDLDNDGWTDLCAGGVVWFNKLGKRFEKGSEVGTVVAADFDNDGFADLFSLSQMRVYRNDRGKGLVPVELPTLPMTVSRGACWGDFNGDGFVDLYIGGFEDWDKDITYPDMILTNRAGRAFELTWSEIRYRARGVTACDFDRDGDLDVYVSNYRLQPNLLWVNDGTGAFVDQAAPRNAIATSAGFNGGHSIGAAWGDFDGDGEFDLFAGNFAHVDSRGDQPKSRFLRGLGRAGSNKFEDKGTCGVQYQESYASPAAGDYDNDGRLDLYFTTVYATASFGKKNYPVLFRNRAPFDFEDATASAGLAELGATYEAAWADFDKDGDLDLATNGKLFVNQTKRTRWLEVKLEGDGKGVNRSAIGAQVRVRTGDATLTRQVEAGTGEGNQNDLILHFGLGGSTANVELEVLWPGGKVLRIRNVRVNRLIKLSFKP